MVELGGSKVLKLELEVEGSSEGKLLKKSVQFPQGQLTCSH